MPISRRCRVGAYGHRSPMTGTPRPLVKRRRVWPAVDRGADDETRTRDIDLGKVALYQLSYIRSARASRARRYYRFMRTAPAWGAARSPDRRWSDPSAAG